MTIRTKLYGAMVVTAAGLALVVGLGFWGMNRLDEHFGAARRAADDRSLALALKYDITDLNGWQTAYGYDSGVSRPIFLRSVAAFRRDDARARERLSSPAERLQLTRIRAAFNDFMRLDDDAFAAVQAGRDRRGGRDPVGGRDTQIFASPALAPRDPELSACRACLRRVGHPRGTALRQRERPVRRGPSGDPAADGDRRAGGRAVRADPAGYGK